METYNIKPLHIWFHPFLYFSIGKYAEENSAEGIDAGGYVEHSLPLRLGTLKNMEVELEVMY